MTSYPLCQDKTITLKKYPEGTRTTSGVAYGDLAVVRIMGHTDYTIVHIPSGLTFKTAKCCFRYQHTAVEAMMEMGRAKNRWRFDSIKELHALQPMIEEIGAKHGGYSAARGPDVPDYKEDMAEPESDIPYSSTSKKRKK